MNDVIDNGHETMRFSRLAHAKFVGDSAVDGTRAGVSPQSGCTWTPCSCEGLWPAYTLRVEIDPATAGRKPAEGGKPARIEGEILK
jgi:hypothetical protein